MKRQNTAPRIALPKKTLAYAIAMLGVAGFGPCALAQSGKVEEIFVTARKVEENLQNTPVAVTALSEESMERRMITSTVDLARVTPNLQFTSYSSLSGNNSAAQVFIRGYCQTDASGVVVLS